MSSFADFPTDWRFQHYSDTMFTEYAVKYVYTALGCTPVHAIGTVILYILTALLVDFIVKYFRCTKYLPPGPWGYPLVGFMPFMRGAMQHLKFGELAKKFGPMFSAKMGSQLVVVLSDHKIIRETFRRDEFTARPHTEFNNILGGYGEFDKLAKACYSNCTHEQFSGIRLLLCFPEC